MRPFLLATLLLTLTACPRSPQQPEPQGLTYEQIDSLLREFRKEHPVPEHYREQLQWSDSEMEVEKAPERR